MKLKRLPEDFRVEELPLVEPGARGRYTFYRLEKRDLGTLEAIDQVRSRWGIEARRLAYGGLKDRHAHTIQYLTIFEGPEQAIKFAKFELQPLGRLDRPYGPTEFSGNRFGIVIRDLAAPALERALRAAETLEHDGLPNYFDDQRFGSVGPGGAFTARAWLLGDAETALRLAIAESTASDRTTSRAEKAILSECWGNWAEAKARLGKSHARSIATYLVDHPTDFRGAFSRLRRDLRGLYFSAFQSHLWNQIVGRLIEMTTRPDQRVSYRFKVATLPIHFNLDDDQARLLRSAQVPLPSSRNAPPEGPVGVAAQAVVAEQGLTWEALRVRWLKDVFFSKGTRPALVFPTNLKLSDTNDELYPKRRLLRLSFELPRGGYATLLVKRLTNAAAEHESRASTALDDSDFSGVEDAADDDRDPADD